MAFMFGTAFGWLILAVIWRLGQITVWIDRANAVLEEMADHIATRDLSAHIDTKEKQS